MSVSARQMSSTDTQAYVVAGCRPWNLFPGFSHARSPKAIESAAQRRGSTVELEAAGAFQLVRTTR